MHVRASELAAQLGRRLAPIYVVHGDEPLLAIEAGDLVRAAARAAGFDQREVLVADAHFDWQELLAASRNLSLFGGRTLIDLRIPGGRPGTAGSAALQQLAASPNPEHLALITLPRLDRATQGSAWFEALERAGVCVAAQPIARDALPRWIAGRLARQQQHASAETLEFLAGRTEGNLLAAHQEIVKLGMLLPAGELDQAAVARATVDLARFDVFDLSEAWLDADAPRVARILRSLEAEGEGVQLVLWQLGEDLHALAVIGEAVAAGMAPAQALKSVRAWGRRQQLLQSAARRHPPEAVGRMLVALAGVDALSKGIGRQGVWEALTDLALALAGRPGGAAPASLRPSGSGSA